ncbi:3-hydroxyisobutyryl-CoA hydrolase-like protein 5 [Lycium ferocissimum]|uniref:3-hydroxyisobutyryl-CoA hydrolase-like protein 5 n=1 Tax=Lycium ferocissimum TaxID=112874 RepID=UPI002815F4DB|nr:3-hydroxyisobutyryl-CoA hydrolase-like protein 5 [Lycium ferocissimum]
MAITSIPSSTTVFPMPQQVLKQSREVVISEEIGRARVLTLNRPNHLNYISGKEALMLGQKFEKYEKDDNAEFVIIKGAGRTFSAGGDLKMFYDARDTRDSCLEAAYRMYWLCYHIHTYNKPHIALVHGMSVGGGASLMVPMKFSVVTEKSFCSTPEASLGFHPDCGFSYLLSRLPGRLGEYLGLTGAKLKGKEVVVAGLATHFVPSQKLFQLERRLLSIKSGEEDAIRSAINEFSTNVHIDERSILNKLSIIDKCFSKDSVEEIVESLEAEASKRGNAWIMPVLKSLKKASPTGLKITLRSIREGRTQTLSECLRREFRISINILRTIISSDFYEGIRACIIDKDKSPKWNPSTLYKVHDEQLDLIFKPFEEHDLEFQIPIKEEGCRWGGQYENSGYCRPNQVNIQKASRSTTRESVLI